MPHFAERDDLKTVSSKALVGIHLLHDMERCLIVGWIMPEPVIAILTAKKTDPKSRSKISVQLMPSCRIFLEL